MPARRVVLCLLGLVATPWPCVALTVSPPPVASVVALRRMVSQAIPATDTGATAAGSTAAGTAVESDSVTARLDALSAQVASELRCPVCRNQSVLESSAALSREMQLTIRRRLAAGATPEEVKAYFVSRYGEWILLRPRARGLGLGLYVLPALVLLLGGTLLLRWLHGRPDQVERREADGLTGEGPEETGIPEADRRWLEDAVRGR